MPIRSLPFAASLTQANVIAHFAFVKIDIATPIGTKRFTDMPTAAGTFTGNIEGSSQTWTETGLIVGPMDQSAQNDETVSWLRFWNLDWQWTTWANSPGLRNATVTVYDAWFNVNPDNSVGSIAGALKMYAGLVDNQELGEEAMLALKPFSTPWAKEVPWVTAKHLGAVGLMPQQSVTIQWGDFLVRGT